MTVRRVSAMLLLVALATLAACSDDSDPAPTAPEGPEAASEAASQPPVDLTSSIAAFLAEPSELALGITTETLAAGEQTMSADAVLAGELASLDVDASQAPNAAGFYGHYDEIPAIFDGTDGYFDVVPDDVWLHVTLERGSSFVGADIARLRDLMLANPVLIAQLLADAPEATASGVTSEAVLDFEVTPAGSELAAQLKELFGIKKVPFSVSLFDGAITKIEVTFVYDVVKGTEARNTVEVTIDVVGPADSADIELPDPSSVQEL